MSEFVLKNKLEFSDGTAFIQIYETPLDCVVKLMDVYLQNQFLLCKQLEKIADKLPNLVIDQDCLLAAEALLKVVKQAHSFEESTIFPLLEIACAEDQSIEDNLRRLSLEHRRDEIYAEEASKALFKFVQDSLNRNANLLSTMLRGGFENTRRHIAFKVVHIWPMLEMLRELTKNYQKDLAPLPQLINNI